jgi:UDP-N-acetylmuramoylalanine--D-glutamate ligase
VFALLGGRAKETDFSALQEPLQEAGATAVVFGEAAPALATALSDRVALVRCDDLAAAVRQAASRAQAGDVVLLAPACASFDAFRNFHERGEFFARLVRRMAGEEERP